MTMPATRRWRLGARARKGFLLLHIVAAGSWIGIDVVIAVLVFTALSTDDPRTAGLSYQALELFAIWPMLTAGLVCLASGIVLGLGSKYGLIKYVWVTVKLALNLALSSLVLISLRYGVAEVAEYGRQLVAGQAELAIQTDLLFPPIVSLSALLFAMLLSVYKPWGRFRRTSGGRS